LSPATAKTHFQRAKPHLRKALLAVLPECKVKRPVR
jgi:hypothetical protein